MNWYIVQCKHSAEAHTAVTIRTVLRLEVYLPEIAQRVRGRMARSAFFPGYLSSYPTVCLLIGVNCITNGRAFFRHR